MVTLIEFDISFQRFSLLQQPRALRFLQLLLEQFRAPERPSHEEQIPDEVHAHHTIDHPPGRPNAEPDIPPNVRNHGQPKRREAEGRHVRRAQQQAARHGLGAKASREEVRGGVGQGYVLGGEAEGDDRVRVDETPAQVRMWIVGEMPARDAQRLREQIRCSPCAEAGVRRCHGGLQTADRLESLRSRHGIGCGLSR